MGRITVDEAKRISLDRFSQDPVASKLIETIWKKIRCTAGVGEFEITMSFSKNESKDLIKKLGVFFKNEGFNVAFKFPDETQTWIDMKIYWS